MTATSSRPTPTTRLNATAWEWACANQQPLVIGQPGHQQTIDPRKLTVAQHARDRVVSVIIEGPVIGRNRKPAGKWVADVLDPTSDRCPLWVRWLVESVARGATVAPDDQMAGAR